MRCSRRQAHEDANRKAAVNLDQRTFVLPSGGQDLGTVLWAKANPSFTFMGQPAADLKLFF